mmetsp:Transcript_5773/g.10002  ORF Transcript_5773/g.10002 Transcript_5773/m.10002 type:complete len:217 (+) Transcript_5773:212-862(+)|eukprot:CAMPEP_0198217664 /NCGR_PEP_ID=MMETSP1445-20131203/65108_1 /TAXON_ID=36898 /ORGANISM="Pyramimonas sp., Strain CCMP2087" /LENGTH=216 /DNA_ID=CAMNT_0043894427 /DNA_START=161 /DNA_END=811 /DNA_ORIENTATION=+
MYQRSRSIRKEAAGKKQEEGTGKMKEATGKDDQSCPRESAEESFAKSTTFIRSVNVRPLQNSWEHSLRWESSSTIVGEEISYERVKNKMSIPQETLAEVHEERHIADASIAEFNKQLVWAQSRCAEVDAEIWAAGARLKQTKFLNSTLQNKIEQFDAWMQTIEGQADTRSSQMCGEIEELQAENANQNQRIKEMMKPQLGPPVADSTSKYTAVLWE